MSKRYPLSLNIATALHSRIDEYTVGDFAALGINKQDFEKLNQDLPWRRDEIRTVMRTFNAIQYGVCEIMGVPKLTLPSEYVAATVAATVAPANQLICCIWLSAEHKTGAGAIEMSARGEQNPGYDHTSGEQLFAIVACLMDTEDSNEVRQRFREKFGLRIKENMETAQ